MPLRDETGAIRYFGAIERDVTDKRSETERLERLALEDVLTGIGNRAALERHMADLSKTSSRMAKTFCMLLFDLDGFKGVNDSLGHVAGDNILRHFAGYLASTLHRDDFFWPDLAEMSLSLFYKDIRQNQPVFTRKMSSRICR